MRHSSFTCDNKMATWRGLLFCRHSPSLYSGPSLRLLMCGSGAGTGYSTAAAEPTVCTEPTKEELEREEPWMQKEITKYYEGKNLLAKLMGEDPEKFAEKDVQEAVRYLLPSSLTAKDARPFLKHPSEIFPSRKESAFDSSGRPLEAGFYTGAPSYHNLIYEIYGYSKMLENNTNSQSSTISPGSVNTESGSSSMSINIKASGSLTTPLQWLKKDTMSNVIAEELTDKRYEDIIERLTSLSSHPNSSMINDFLNKYRKPHFIRRIQANLPKVGENGYIYTVGKRKTSVAKTWTKQGQGRVTVNNRTLVDYFPRIEDRHQVLYPLMAIDQLGKWDVEVKVQGGGSSGQAGAIRLGVSKALMAIDGGDHVEDLEKAGLLIRDPRMVERKKPGQKKARKKFAWVKR